MSENAPRVIDPQTQEHIDRFLEGREKWNEWAEGMLAQKKELEEAGKWRVEIRRDGQSRYREMSANPEEPEIQAWLDEAYVDFSNLCLKSEVIKVREETEICEMISIKSIELNEPSTDFGWFIFPSATNFSGAMFESNAYFYGAKFKDRVDFERARFKGGSNFGAVRFMKVANFCEAQFKWVSFSAARFKDLADFNLVQFNESEADFYGVCFQNTAYFYQAKFRSGANFHATQFKYLADFTEVQFKGWLDSSLVDFSLADFSRGADFTKVQFWVPANFEAIKSRLSFHLANVKFIYQVPNFSQANFAESPRLDHVEVQPRPTIKLMSKEFFPKVREFLARYQEKTDLERSLKLENWPRLARWRRRFVLREFVLNEQNDLWLDHDKKRFDNTLQQDETGTIVRSKDHEAYFRTLKRLAIQAHDHHNEMAFFAGEIRARRFVWDFPFQNGLVSALRYWAGVLYEVTSDFGRSLIRPLVFWGLSFAVFACLYFAQARPEAMEVCATTKDMSPFAAVNTIAAKNALPFFNLDRVEKLKRAPTCLYGAAPVYDRQFYPDGFTPQASARKTSYEKPHAVRQDPPSPSFKPHMAPTVPGWVTVFGIFYTLFSLVFIFLLLLAIRNQFKIK